MDSSATKGNVPLPRYGSDDREPFSQIGYNTHDMSPTHGSPSSVDTQAVKNDEIYVNIPQIEEEPVYDDIGNFKTEAPEVNELISTETEYVRSLQLLIFHIQPRLEEVKRKDFYCNNDLHSLLSKHIFTLHIYCVFQ